MNRTAPVPLLTAGEARADDDNTRRHLRGLRRRTLAAAAAAAVLAVPSGTALAAPGALDTQFGNGGKLTTAVLQGYSNQGNAAAADTLGRVWVAGTSKREEEIPPSVDQTATIVRYGATGLDPTFGLQGKQRIHTVGPSRGNDVITYQSQVPGERPRALVAGSLGTDGARRPLIAALRDDGTPDPTWSQDGLVSHAVPGASDVELTAIARRSDGKIVVAGRADGPGLKVRAFVARYTAAGVLDNSFSGDGMLLLEARQTIAGSLVPASRTLITDIVLEKPPLVLPIAGLGAADLHAGIKLVGSATYDQLPVNDRQSALVVALRADGNMDTAFAGGGMRHVAFGAGNDWFTAAVAQADNRIVLVGGRDIPISGSSSSQRAAVTARLNSNGSLDLGYGGGNGVTRWHPGRQVAATGVTLSGGRILVVCSDTGGPDGAQSDPTFTVVAYLPDGDADFAWGPSGNAEVRANVLLNGYERASAIAARPNGMVVLAGTAGNEFAVVSLRPL